MKRWRLIAMVLLLPWVALIQWLQVALIENCVASVCFGGIFAMLDDDSPRDWGRIGKRLALLLAMLATGDYVGCVSSEPSLAGDGEPREYEAVTGPVRIVGLAGMSSGSAASRAAGGTGL